MTELIAIGLAIVVAIQWRWIGHLRGQLDTIQEERDALDQAFGDSVSFLEVRRHG